MIQIDMPMPKNCLDCPACNEYLTCAIPVNGRGWGENDVREFGQSRPEWCPLKEQEAKTGHWVSVDDGEVVAIDNDGFPERACFCSECKKYLIASDEYAVYGKYCPFCGAKMEGSEVND